VAVAGLLGLWFTWRDGIGRAPGAAWPWGWTLSMVAGVSLSAVIADWQHWRAVYGAVFLLAGGALAMLFVSGHADTRSDEPAPSPLEALSIPGVAPLLIACGAFMTAFYGVYGYLGDHLHEGLGLPLSANGMVTLAYGLGFGAAALLDGFEHRLPARLGLPLAFLAVLLVYVLLALGGEIHGAVLTLAFFWGLTNHFGLNLLIVRLTALRPARRGAIMGLNSAVTYIAAFAGSLGFGPLYTTLGFAAISGIAAGLMAVSVVAALSLICVDQSKRDPQLAERLAAIKAVSSWSRGDLVIKNGWATMPGTTEADSQVARVCAEKVTA
jgi:predicted MFS family arabinose efflux permease